MNKIQKTILAIFIPILILVISYGVAETIFDFSYEKTSLNYITKEYETRNVIDNVKAYDLGKTWWVWGAGISFIMGSLLEIYRDRRKNK